MDKKTILLAIVSFALGALLMSFLSSWLWRGQEGSYMLDSKNCTYNIDNQEISLVNGQAEQEITPGSASKLVTRYFGNESYGDFNGDGFSDTAFLVMQNSGGSGTFYYVVAALGSKDKCIGTNAIFIGDRIAPQNTEFKNGEIIVNYADRKADEPMVALPSVGVSKYFKVNGNQLIEWNTK